MIDVSWLVAIHGGLLATPGCSTIAVSRIVRPSAAFLRGEADLSDEELAAINGGAELVAITAVTELRRSHVAPTLEGGLVAHGPLADGAGPLERELFEAVSRDPGKPAGAVVADAARGVTVQRIVERVTDEGLRLDAHAIFQLTVLWRAAQALTPVGAVAVVLAIVEDAAPSLCYVAALLLVCTRAVTGSLGTRRGGASSTGRRLLESVARSRAGALDVAGGRPAFAVAMLGAAALWHIDPGFASALDIPTGAEAAWSACLDSEGGCGG